jgi:hypothetical protein
MLVEAGREKEPSMDLLLIPILLLFGGGLLYFGINGLPDISRLPLNLRREPFALTDWLKTRPAPRHVMPIEPGPEHDAELVELMNEMIGVREELTGLKLAMADKPARPRSATTRKPLKAQPAMHAKAAAVRSQKAEKHTEARRQASTLQGGNRRYLRT